MEMILDWLGPLASPWVTPLADWTLLTIVMVFINIGLGFLLLLSAAALVILPLSSAAAAAEPVLKWFNHLSDGMQQFVGITFWLIVLGIVAWLGGFAGLYEVPNG